MGPCAACARPEAGFIAPTWPAHAARPRTRWRARPRMCDAQSSTLAHPPTRHSSTCKSPTRLRRDCTAQWARQTARTRTACSSSTSTSRQTTRSSLLRSTSRPGEGQGDRGERGGGPGGAGRAGGWEVSWIVADWAGLDRARWRRR
eukprot:141912-Chlamydomonas_euryale.AAC.2